MSAKMLIKCECSIDDIANNCYSYDKFICEKIKEYDKEQEFFDKLEELNLDTMDDITDYINEEGYDLLRELDIPTDDED